MWPDKAFVASAGSADCKCAKRTLSGVCRNVAKVAVRGGRERERESDFGARAGAKECSNCSPSSTFASRNLLLLFFLELTVECWPELEQAQLLDPNFECWPVLVCACYDCTGLILSE